MTSFAACQPPVRRYVIVEWPGPVSPLTSDLIWANYRCRVNDLNRRLTGRRWLPVLWPTRVTSSGRCGCYIIRSIKVVIKLTPCDKIGAGIVYIYCLITVGGWGVVNTCDMGIPMCFHYQKPNPKTSIPNASIHNCISILPNIAMFILTSRLSRSAWDLNLTSYAQTIFHFQQL